ncbi:MAG: methionine biosynthesis protein MetW [Spirochaetales bacterium]|nr:methionine biosynthesis protein MetW [Spirochaetales bacterium]MBQ2294028.1 methionine biosynthesis protein MetW [Spirochaetales bacterium]
MKLPRELVAARISDEIAPGSRVLDLGCGDGSLLKHLKEVRNVVGYGIEIDSNAILSCINKDINVLHWNLNDLPLDFPDHFYDTVILTHTLQQVLKPKDLIDEMLRVGKEVILSFPNFGQYKLRLKLLTGGRMPATPTLPDKWYETPNIKLLTVNDFYDFCEENDIEILTHYFFRKSKYAMVPVRNFANLRADVAMFKIRRK